MVQYETPADYQALQAQLAALDIPYLPMVGNHDDRVMMKAHLDVPDSCMADFVLYSVATDEAVFLCLDTQKPASAAGEFCAQRMAWLKGELERAGEMPVFIFMHHPPMDLDLPAQDEIRLENGVQFLDMVAAYPNVRHFRWSCASPGGGVHPGHSICRDAGCFISGPAPKPDWDWDGFAPVPEPANIGVITLRKDAVNLHYIQF